MMTTIPLNELPRLLGAELGRSEYREITQDQINRFAQAAEDDQWIHTEPECAKDGPYRVTIAHGYLTLSLVIPFSEELLDVKGVGTKANYGLNRARFPSPVTVGVRIQMRAAVADVVEIPGGYQIVLDNVIEIEDEAKPAVVATSLLRFYE